MGLGLVVGSSNPTNSHHLVKNQTPSSKMEGIMIARAIPTSGSLLKPSSGDQEVGIPSRRLVF